MFLDTHLGKHRKIRKREYTKDNYLDKLLLPALLHSRDILRFERFILDSDVLRSAINYLKNS